MLLTPMSRQRGITIIQTCFAIAVATVAVVAIVLWFARMSMNAAGGHDSGRDPSMSVDVVNARLKPVGEITMAAAAAATGAAAAPAAAGGAAPAAANGEAVFKGTCIACHGSGVLGAPKFGDKAAWAPRAAKGLEALYGSALKGKNAMPAKGGNAGLSDDEVKAAVQYMVNAAK